MGKITDALKKLQEERQIDSQNERKDTVQSYPEECEKISEEALTGPQQGPMIHRPPLEERLRNRIYIAKATDDSGIDPRIVAYFDPQAVISEQYRILRTNIQLNNLPKAVKTIVISSALHAEGKTVTAVNLAVTMAQDLDKTVLLVDCDLRGGTVHQLLAINPARGLSALLTDNTTLGSTFYKTRINNLTILPRGDVPHNPSELLGSKKMRRLLEELKSGFDYIILDSPPIISLTDTCVLSSQVDGVIFIVQAYRTPRQAVEHAQNSLKHVHAKILGLVLTQTEDSLPKYMYRYFQRDKLDNLAELTQ